MKRLILASLVLLGPAAASAAPAPYLGGQVRDWVFSNHNDLRDVLAYWVPGPVHVTLEYWDFLDPASKDQFRPEVGVHARDVRRSVYTAQWRHEQNDERLTFGTDQVLGRGWVARGEVSPLLGKDSTLVVVSGGADYYWGSYHFASATVIHDPRGNDLWVMPVRVRLATESNDWLQATLAPSTKRTLGWAFDLRWRGVRLGVERNSRYDFTNLDNTIYSVGFERNYGVRP